MTFLYAVSPPPSQAISAARDFESFLTADSITRKALERAQRCAESGSEIVWIEGACGTGKSLLAGIIAEKQGSYAEQPFRVGHFPLQDVQMDKVVGHGFNALCIHIPSSIELVDVQRFQYQMNAYSRLYQGRIHLLCLMSLPTPAYRPIVARQLSLMKQVYIQQHYEYITLQPLKHRLRDIPLLAEHIFRKLSFLYDGMPHTPLSFASIASQLAEVEFADNMWGLQRACLYLLQHGKIPDPPEVAGHRTSVTHDHSGHSHCLSLVNEQGQLRSYEEMEKEIYQFACLYYQGSKSAAARALGIGRTTLYRKSV